MDAQQVDENTWKQKLTPDQYKILREKGTEAPFSGELFSEDRFGNYHCAGCNTTLFTSDSKYESDIAGLAGWPSFATSANDDVVTLKDDFSLGMKRIEVICATCEGHLGHIFPDPGSPSGQHYCINSLALDFKPEKQ